MEARTIEKLREVFPDKARSKRNFLNRPRKWTLILGLADMGRIVLSWPELCCVAPSVLLMEALWKVAH